MIDNPRPPALDTGGAALGLGSDAGDTASAAGRVSDWVATSGLAPEQEDTLSALQASCSCVSALLGGWARCRLASRDRLTPALPQHALTAHLLQRVLCRCISVLVGVQAAVVLRRLPILNVQWGNQPTDSIGMPVAAYLLGECLLRWGSTWKTKEVCLASEAPRGCLRPDITAWPVPTGSHQVQPACHAVLPLLPAQPLGMQPRPGSSSAQQQHSLQCPRAPVLVQMEGAVSRLRDGILGAAEADGLTGQAYWLSSTLALGAFLKVCAPHPLCSSLAMQLFTTGAWAGLLRAWALQAAADCASCVPMLCLLHMHPAGEGCPCEHLVLLLQVRSIGKRDYNSLFKLGDEMIQFQGLHTLLAAAVAESVPVNVGVLLSEDVKRQVRTPRRPHCNTAGSCRCWVFGGSRPAAASADRRAHCRRAQGSQALARAAPTAPLRA